MKTIKNQKFDVAIVGAGASGCLAAERLCSLGYKVALLDAGSADGTQARTTKSWAKKVRSDYRIQQKSEAFSAANESFFVKDSENPYSYSAKHPFYWIRNRGLGGRMNLWTGECYRMSNLDFKASSRDGVGTDWPLDHDQLVPNYERVEEILRVHGHHDQIETIPDGNIIKAPPFNSYEKYVQEKLKTHGIPVIRDRLAQGESSKPPNMHSLIHNAEKTGKLTYFPGSVVQSLIRGKSGLIERVQGVSSIKKGIFSLKASSFIVCASTLESTRIVMNSAFKNIRGQKVLGHYLNDHIGGPKGLMVHGYFPYLSNDNDYQQKMLYVPRYQNLGTSRTWPFRRGFSTRVCLKRINPFLMGFALTAFGEALPYADNKIELNTQKRDRWGSPSLRVRFALKENESHMFDYMKWELTRIAQSLTEGKGAKIASANFQFQSAGLCNHEVGTCRMGDDPKESFLNSYCRSHDIENLYVTDGSSFPNLGTANPTLTLMALTDRACADLAKRL